MLDNQTRKLYYSGFLNKIRTNADIAWALFAVIIVLWAQGVCRIQFSTPLSISGDHICLLIPAKMLLRGHFWADQALGYPLGHSTAFFPDFEIALKAILMVFSGLGLEPLVVEKWFVISGIILMTVAGFFCLRKLDIRAWLAATGAIAFVISPFFATRVAAHDFLSIYVTIPFGCTLPIFIARCNNTTNVIQLLKSRFSILSTLIIATCGIYYAFFSIFFMGIASLIVAIKIKRITPPLCIAILGFTICSITTVAGLGPFLFDFLKGNWSQPVRYPLEQVLYGLMISDALYVFNDIGIFSKQIKEYVAARTGGEGLGEWPGIVLSLIVLLCPFTLLFRIRYSIAMNGRYLIIGLAAAFVTLGLLFAQRGGFGYLFSELISPMIRAQNRIMQFLSFFAIIILCQISEILLTRVSWKARLAAIGGPALMILAVLPHRHAVSQKQAQMLADPASVANLTSMKAMLAAKTTYRLNAVLEMPIEPWPEYVRNGFDSYGFALPFILDSRESNTKWSYGMALRQQGFSEFRTTIRGEEEPAGLPKRALALGFDGILIEKRALLADELSHLENGIGLAESCRIYDDTLQTLYIINQTTCAGAAAIPSSGPIEFNFGKGNNQEFLISGWWAEEDLGVWSIGSNSTLLLPRPAGTGKVEIRLSFSVFRATPGITTIKVKVNGHTLNPIEIAEAQRGKASAMLDLPTDILGSSPMIRIDFEFPNAESPALTGSNDTRVLSMFLEDIKLTAQE